MEFQNPKPLNELSWQTDQRNEPGGQFDGP